MKTGFSNSLFRYYAPDNLGEKDALYAAYYECLVEHDDMEAFIPHLQTFYKSFHIHWSITMSVIIRLCSILVC